MREGRILGDNVLECLEFKMNPFVGKLFFGIDVPLVLLSSFFERFLVVTNKRWILENQKVTSMTIPIIFYHGIFLQKTNYWYLPWSMI